MATIELVIVILGVAIAIVILVMKHEVVIGIEEAAIATRDTTTKYRWVTVIAVLV